MGATSKWHFVPRVPKFPKLGLSRLWGPITLFVNLWLRWGLTQSCSPCQELSNFMSHATCTQGNWGDSRLLVVGSQTTNLTPNLSIGHNLCVLSVQIGHASPFQTFKFQNLFNDIRNVSIQWVLTLEIAFWRFRSPFGLQLPNGSSLGSVKVGVWAQG
jgi:hypothetical protein